MSNSVILREIATASGHRFGHASLNAPGTLNALSLEMIRALQPQFDQWIADPGVAGIVLDGTGERAFCSGGDVAALCRAIRAAAPNETPVPLGMEFFAREYRLDHTIHTCPKPVLCWGHGVVMGGGIGLMAGASHRVVTPQSRLAMPEINIGLYPEVGASWFLQRIPAKAGLFMALTAAQLNAADARFAGLADFVMSHSDRQATLEQIAQAHWVAPAGAGRAENHARLTHLLNRNACRDELPPSRLRSHFDVIETTIGNDTLPDIAARLRSLCGHEDEWLAAAGKAFSGGSPASAALSYALWQRARRLSLADVFRIEYTVSVACTVHHDFPEGVRALLIDKDKTPHWQHRRVEDVDAAFVEDHFRPRLQGAHPLADLA